MILVRLSVDSKPLVRDSVWVGLGFIDRACFSSPVRLGPAVFLDCFLNAFCALRVVRPGPADLIAEC